METIPYSHFYQTSMWGDVKNIDRWQSLKIEITRDNSLIGGFQLLIKSYKYIGKIGLILKGPVLSSNDFEIMNFTLDVLKKITRDYALAALIVQPPDRDEEISDFLLKHNFCLNHLENAVKNNSVVIDLRGSEDEIFKAIKRTKRQNINTAIRKGVTVREGNREHLGLFFQYMLETCKRQQVQPSPSNLEFLEKMWDAFYPSGHIKMFLSEYENKIISCLIVIPFGDTVYLWKFGWSGEHPKLFANLIIYWEIFKWAKAHGFHYADLGAVSKDIAETSWKGEAISAELAKTYSYFKTSFGGKVVRLSNGFVYIPNSFVRWAYNILMPFINSNHILKKRLIFPAND